jgi:hypothetical protein
MRFLKSPEKNTMDLNRIQWDSKFHPICLFLIVFYKPVLSTGDVRCTTATNVFKPCALNPKFQHFIPNFFFKMLLTIVTLKLERGFKDERTAPNRSKQGHFMKNSSM